MSDRVELQFELESILGSKCVFYQPPENLKITYPAIVYDLSDILTVFADNKTRMLYNSYSVTLITKNPDNEFVDKILQLPYCRFNRRFVNDNLYHDVFVITRRNK